MRKIDFRPGYYEWQVIVDGEVVHSFNDFSEYFEEENITTETVYNLIDDLIWSWREDCLENECSFPLTTQETVVLIEIMKITIWQHYEIDSQEEI